MSSNHNHLVIMAGGVGSRFWPMSTTDYPKQFIDVLGCGRTLIQLTKDRFEGICPPENIWIVTSDKYADEVKRQLPEVADDHILREPCRRNTAPCIAYVSWKIKSRDPKANMVVTPSDHVVLDVKEFQRVIVSAMKFTNNSDAILTLGMKPNRPETGYGYIEADLSYPSNYNKEIYRVDSFKEKPNLATAERYIKKPSYFWNAGIFLWKAETIQKKMEKYLPEVAGLFKGWESALGTSVENEFIAKAYTGCRNISIDYGVMEKTDEAWMYPVKFGWSDVGTWESLYNIIPEKDAYGNAVSAEKTLIKNTRGVLVVSPEKKKLIAIKGLEDYMVVDTEDVLVICPKDDKKFKDFITGLGMPDYEKYR